MPNPKPRTHLLCRLCNKREKVSCGYCTPCLDYYERMNETQDVAALRPIISGDILRQKEALREGAEVNSIA